jgi:uncharacterized protein (DUF924 family)
MNQRIRELANSAGLPTYNPQAMPTKLEHFAYLLIRECTELNKQELSFSAFETLLNKYSEHFGEYNEH